MTGDLDRLLAGADALSLETGLRVVVIGGAARSMWAPARATQDVDILIGGSEIAGLARWRHRCSSASDR